MSKLYTKTGDFGMTYLYDGSRRKKNSIFFDVLGDIDELSSHIGMLCAILYDCRALIRSSFQSEAFNDEMPQLIGLTRSSPGTNLIKNQRT